jgi:hypothetical protein
MRRMKRSQVVLVTATLLKRQSGKCDICGEPVGAGTKKTAALDHDHDTGYVRGVLCINCNGIEGKIRNLVRRLGRGRTKTEMLASVLAYWFKHQEPQWGGIYHHTHLTDEEKRLERNKKAAVARKKAKDKL